MARDPREAPDALLQFNTDAVILVAAFKEEWAQGATELKLPEDDAEDVRGYLHFLYTGKIACIVTDEGPDHLHEKETMLLARLYVLGEKYQDVHFKYSAIDAMVAKHHDPEEKGGSGWSPSGPDVDVIYRGTCADSPVRKLMVDMHMQAGWGNWIRENGIHNLEFMKDLCAAMLDSRHEERVAGNLEYKGIGQSVSYHEEVEGK